MIIIVIAMTLIVNVLYLCQMGSCQAYLLSIFSLHKKVDWFLYIDITSFVILAFVSQYL